MFSILLVLVAIAPLGKLQLLSTHASNSRPPSCTIYNLNQWSCIRHHVHNKFDCHECTALYSEQFIADRAPPPLLDDSSDVLSSIQFLTKNDTIADSGNEADHVNQTRNAMHAPKSFVKSHHFLGMRRRVVALLAIAGFYTSQPPSRGFKMEDNVAGKYLPWCFRSRMIFIVSGRSTN